MEQSKNHGAVEWKPCPGFEECYAVSNTGLVRRTSHVNPNRQAGNILRPNTNSIDGYPAVTLSTTIPPRRSSIVRVHRLVAMAFLPMPSPRHQVNHKDGNKLNCHIDNLEWVTPSQNVRHAIDVLGHRNRKRKLTAQQVQSILAAHQNGQTCSALARQYGIARSSMQKICFRRTWRHVQPNGLPAKEHS